MCVNVEWVDRIDDTLKFQQQGGSQQKVETRSILPKEIVWLRQGRQQLHMSDDMNDELCDMCDRVLDLV